MPRADWAVAAPGHRATPPAAAPAARTVEHATVIVSLDGGRTRECLPCDEDKMGLWSSAPGADCHPGLCRPATFPGCCGSGERAGRGSGRPSYSGVLGQPSRSRGAIGHPRCRSETTELVDSDKKSVWGAPQHVCDRCVV